jgi:hypothetical protein
LRAARASSAAAAAGRRRWPPGQRRGGAGVADLAQGGGGVGAHARVVAGEHLAQGERGVLAQEAQRLHGVDQGGGLGRAQVAVEVRHGQLAGAAQVHRRATAHVEVCVGDGFLGLGLDGRGVGGLLGGRRLGLAQQVLHQALVLATLREGLDQHLLVHVAQEGVDLFVAGVGRHVLLQLGQRLLEAILLVRLHGVLERLALGEGRRRRAQRAHERRSARQRKEQNEGAVPSSTSSASKTGRVCRDAHPQRPACLSQPNPRRRRNFGSGRD